MARGTYRLIRKRTQESEGRWKCQTPTRQLKSRPLERFASSNVPSVNRAPVRFASASKLVASATRMSSRSRDYFPTLNFLAFPGHEAIGRIDGLGAGVTGWKVGQRV